jgi:hypothetical protein
MRVGKALGDVAENGYDIAYRQLPVAREPRAQGVAVDEGHGEMRECRRMAGAVRHRAGSEHGDDVRMLETRREKYLAPESLHVHPGGELRRQHFHDHSTAQREIVRDEDARHSPAAELAGDPEALPEVGLQLVPQRVVQSTHSMRMPTPDHGLKMVGRGR